MTLGRPFCLQGWRVPYYGAGVVALAVAVLMALTLREPERQAIGEESTKQAGEAATPTWKVLVQPRIVLLCIAASIRHCGESCCGVRAKSPLQGRN